MRFGCRDWNRAITIRRNEEKCALWFSEFLSHMLSFHLILPIALQKRGWCHFIDSKYDSEIASNLSKVTQEFAELGLEPRFSATSDSAAALSAGHH